MRNFRKKSLGTASILLLCFLILLSACSVEGPKNTQNNTPNNTGGTNQETQTDDTGSTGAAVERFGTVLDNLNLDDTLKGQYEGKKLTIPVMSGDFEAAINEVVPLFEQYSGADVVIETAPGAQLTEKIQLDLSSTHRYDIILAPIANLHSYAEAGSIEKLQTYIDNQSGESYDAGDFLPGLFETSGKYKGEVVAIPYKPDVQLLFYRTDLFEDAGLQEQYKAKYGAELKVPETNEEMLQVAEFFTKSLNPESPVDYGYVNTMLKGASRWLWINRGATVTDAEGKPGFNNDAGLKAMETTLALQDYAPKEWLQMGWDEGNQFFANGNAAMMEQWPGLWSTVQADTSQVKGKVGIAVTPGKTPVLGGWGISIAAESKEKELAWKFIEFVTSMNGELLKIEKTMDPTRASVYAIEDVAAYNPNYEIFMESLKHAGTLADVDVPYATAQLNDVAELYTQKVLNKELSPKDAIDQMDKEFNSVIEKITK